MPSVVLLGPFYCNSNNNSSNDKNNIDTQYSDFTAIFYEIMYNNPHFVSSKTFTVTKFLVSVRSYVSCIPTFTYLF